MLTTRRVLPSSVTCVEGGRGGAVTCLTLFSKMVPGTALVRTCCYGSNTKVSIVTPATVGISRGWFYPRFVTR